MSRNVVVCCRNIFESFSIFFGILQQSLAIGNIFYDVRTIFNNFFRVGAFSIFVLSDLWGYCANNYKERKFSLYANYQDWQK